MSIAMIGCSERSATEELPINSDKTYENSNLSARTRGTVSFTFTYGRASKDCQGFGICKLAAFGVYIVGAPKINVSLEPAQPPFVLDTYKAYHALETGYEINGLDDTTFYVDEDFYITDDEENTFKIHQGEYDFDSSIGSFGGYLLNVTKI